MKSVTDITCLVVVLASLMASQELIAGTTSSPKAGSATQATSRPVELSEEKEILLGSLPNGLAVLVDHDHYNNCIFSFFKGKLQKDPFRVEDTKPASKEAFLDRVQKEQIGDVMYDNVGDGVLVVNSTQVQELGAGTLAELRKELPAALSSKRSVPARVGNRYLIKTVDGKYALARALARNRMGFKLQWVYQPDGSTNFAGKGSFLERKIDSFELDLAPASYARPMMNAAYRLRDVGLRVCFEPMVDEPWEVPGPKKEMVKNVTVKGLLDEVVKRIPAYEWTVLEGTNIICIYPREGSLLAWVPDVNGLNLPIRNRSWLKVVKQLHLEEHQIILPTYMREWASSPSQMVRFEDVKPSYRKISLDVGASDNVRTILAKLCYAYGDEMYFDLRDMIPDRTMPAARKKISFVVPQEEPMHRSGLDEITPDDEFPGILSYKNRSKNRSVFAAHPVITLLVAATTAALCILILRHKRAVKGNKRNEHTDK